MLQEEGPGWAEAWRWEAWGGIRKGAYLVHVAKGSMKGCSAAPSICVASVPGTTLSALIADLMHSSYHSCESCCYLHFTKEETEHAQRVELLAQGHSLGVSGHGWSPSVCRAGDLPSAPCCPPGDGRRVMKKEGEAGWGPGPRTWSPPVGRFSFILLVEGQPLTGASHIWGGHRYPLATRNPRLSALFYALRLSGLNSMCSFYFAP